jgi:hypothetical protein
VTIGNGWSISHSSRIEEEQDLFCFVESLDDVC